MSEREDPLESWHRLFSANGQVSGVLGRPHKEDTNLPLIICVHGIGSNGNYFNLKTNSLAAAARKLGFPVLLLDRPGYGASVEQKAGSAIDNGIDAVTSIVQSAVSGDDSLLERPLALIGHSFGGAVALAYAACASSPPIAALCVSGIGDRPDTRYLEQIQDMKQQISAPFFPHWFFGPPNSYNSRGVSALRPATEPPLSREIYEISHIWPDRWPELAASLTCPLHFRLAEFERIWEATPTAIERVKSALSRSVLVDAAILPEGGHLYEAHRRGPELVSEQLAFISNATRLFG